jgi:cellobiose phosphorylase
LSDHLFAACHWLQNEVRTGAHGLLRAGADDWHRFLNVAGAGGRAESVVNTSLLIYALDLLLALPDNYRPEPVVAEKLTAWQRQLMAAVNSTFDGNWFRRGYSGTSRAIGSIATDRVFIDAQAWAVLARCGTANQRELALEQVLGKCAGEPAHCTISAPYQPPPPADISNCRTPAGVGFNGGVSPAACAWLVWALAEAGHKDKALLLWEQFALRTLTERFPSAARGTTDPNGCLAAGDAPFPAGNNTITPHLWAWQHFAMKKILE